MKKLLLALVLLTPACASLTDWLARPASPAVEVSEEPQTVGEALVDGAAKTAGGAVTISTGNAALGLAVMTLVAMAGKAFIKRRTKAPPPPAAQA